MQGIPLNMQDTNGNSTDSPVYQCRSGGIPSIDASAPYCIVHGGAKRMAVCCAESSNGTSSVNFQPDCYSWCNVDLQPYIGFDPLIPALRKFSQCLEQGQDPTYSPDMLCQNGTTDRVPDPSTSTQPAVPTPTSSGAERKSGGKGVKFALGLVILSAVVKLTL